MFLSVIIPVYNGEKYLRQAVESILMQRYQELEVICVNDGSLDNSETILREIEQSDNRVRVFSQKNQGVASARNFGVSKARGHYIAFLDQDDCYCKHVLTEELVKRAMAKPYDMVSFAYYESNQDMNRGRLVLREDGERHNLADFAGEHYRHHSSYFYRTEFVRKNKIQTDVYRNEDERFRMQCVYAAEWALYCSQNLFVYRNNKTSVTHQKGKNVLVLDSCYKGFSLLSQQSNNSKVVNYALDTMLHLLLDMAKQMSMEGTSQKCIVEALEERQVHALYGRKTWMSTSDVSNWKLYFEQMRVFILKHRLIRVVEDCLRMGLRCRVVSVWYDKHKYPYALENVI